jgi:hypothetical protein
MAFFVAKNINATLLYIVVNSVMIAPPLRLRGTCEDGCCYPDL